MTTSPHANAASDDIPTEPPLLVLPATWATHFDRAPGTWLDPLVGLLPQFLARQRWFAAKGQAIERLAIVRQLLWQRRWLLLQLDIALADGQTQDYWLPLAIAWMPGGGAQETAGDDAGDAAIESPDASDVLARVRHGERAGLLYDALADAGFCHALLAATSRGERLAGPGGVLAFVPSSAFARLAGDDFASLPVRRAGATSSNTAVLLGQRLFLKAYRRLSQGINPEVEMARFLTDVSPYAHIAPLAGALEYQRRDGSVIALAMLQGFVASQGDAWSHTLTSLAALIDGSAPADHAADWRHWSTLGRRTGELHAALAKTTGDPAFDPEPIVAADVQRWTAQIDDEAQRTLAELERRLGELPATLQARAQTLLAARPEIRARINAALPAPGALRVTRYHGDYHLGQVLVVAKDFGGIDFRIIDFEGEPSRPLAQRRRKHSPLRDVAGMLRSFNYAASSALAQAQSEQRAPGEHQAALAARLGEWEARAGAAFLDGYRQAQPAGPGTGADAPAKTAADSPASAALLELLLLEKAFYELRYELNHRPDWVHVPLGGLLGLLRA